MGHFRTNGGTKCRNPHPSSRPSAEEGTCKVHLGKWYMMRSRDPVDKTGRKVFYISWERWGSDCKVLEWRLKCLDSVVRIKSCSFFV